METPAPEPPAAAARSTAIELYSGIGGLHLALKLSGLVREEEGKVEEGRANGDDVGGGEGCMAVRGVAAAFDMNENANRVYASNFGQVRVSKRNVLLLNPGDKEFDQLLAPAKLLLLSPPCQPYTRRKLNRLCSSSKTGGEADRSGAEDARTWSLHHLIELMADKGTPLPEALLLENVLGFERSESFQRLLAMFRRRGYHWQALVMTPLMLGVPNSRPRLYVIARRRPFGNAAWDGCVVQEHRGAPGGKRNAPSEEADPAGVTYAEPKPGEVLATVAPHMSLEGLVTPHMARAVARVREGELPTEALADSKVSGSRLADFLEPGPHELIDAVSLWKAGNMYLVATPQFTWTSCVTKSYAKFQLGAGSVLCTADAFAEEGDEAGALERICAVQDAFKEERRKIAESDAFQNSSPKSSSDKWAAVAAEKGGCPTLEPLKLRYFTPREIANLLGFPRDYDLSGAEPRQQYSLLGNSLSVHTAAFALRYLSSARWSGASKPSPGSSRSAALE